jgi:hypothetical protein
VKLTTLGKEFFMPGFLGRDEGEREPPDKYPWTASAVSGLPGFADTTAYYASYSYPSLGPAV